MIEFSTVINQKKKVVQRGENIFKGNHVKQDKSENRDTVSVPT